MNILIRDDFLAIGNLTKEQLAELKLEYTFKDTSKAMTSRGYNKRNIVKVKMFFIKDNYFVLRTGFLKSFLLFVRKKKWKIEIQDNRKKFDHQGKFELDDLKKYFNPKFKYTEHQQRALQAMLKTNNGILKLPTSSGKSSILSGYLKATDLNILVIVPGVSLVVQLYEDLKEQGFDVGMCSGKGIKLGKIIVSTIGSVKKLDLTNFDGVIFDEVHTVAAKTYQDFLEHTNFKIRFGMSATPDADGEFKWAKIRQFLGEIISETESKELLENEVITPPKIFFKQIESKPAPDYPSSYNIGIVENKDRNKVIANIVSETEKQTLILFKIIEHGDILKELIPDAELLSGKDSIEIRNKAIMKFKNGEIKTLIASNIFNTGISINNIELFINASAGKSKIQTLQKIGRALRKAEGKKVATIIDFMDYGNKFLERHSNQRINLYKDAGFLDIVVV